MSSIAYEEQKKKDNKDSTCILFSLGVIYLKLHSNQENTQQVVTEF